MRRQRFEERAGGGGGGGSKGGGPAAAGVNCCRAGLQEYLPGGELTNYRNGGSMAGFMGMHGDARRVGVYPCAEVGLAGVVL